MALPLIATGVGLGLGVVGDEQARQADIQGTKEASANIERGRTFSEQLINEALSLQQPFIEAGQAALPGASAASIGELDFRESPIFGQRESTGMDALLNAIQGDEVSGFAGDRFSTGLGVSEEALQPARLQDLLNIGLGASGSAGIQSGNLANLETRAALQGGNLASTGAQSGFESRQNTINQILSEFGGLPSFFEATRQDGQPTRGASPTVRGSRGAV